LSEPIPEAAAHAGFAPELRVDWIEPEQLGSAGGRLGMTVLPGKRGASQRYPGLVYQRDLDADIAALRDAGVVRLILLVEDAELARWSDPALPERAGGLGVSVIRHPIPDGAPPPSLAAMRRILEDIDAGRQRGDVAVACMGGVGRTGTVAACALIRGGRSARDAIELVRTIRHPTAVETRDQEAFVEAFAAAQASSGSQSSEA
jgi:protein-tyrosine phosphatase